MRVRNAYPENPLPLGMGECQDYTIWGASPRRLSSLDGRGVRGVQAHRE